MQGNSGGRPPSPLRNGFIPSSGTGIDPNAFDDDDDEEEEEDDDETDERAHIQRSPSPASSVSQMAASFAQRMGNLVNGMTAPRSPSLPSDAELEAEAERERDRTRREAERILSREAAERKMVEERVLAMMESTRGLSPPPSRSQTMPNPNPPSPAGSQKESWWTAAKNKLTPTKELTPAQQVIQDVKIRDKEMKRLSKGKEKEWSSNPNLQGTYAQADPAFNLNIPPTTPTPQAPRRPAPGSPASPTPSRNMAPNLTPSPLRSKEGGTSSPSREAPPLYAQFNAQGTLDVHVTLLTIAKRFEKLEKWTVGHVRALEERMSDVERWLVDKEKEKESASVVSSVQQQGSSHSDVATTEIRELREEIVELQGRIGEIGREMARLAVSPGNLSSAKSVQSATPPTSSMHEKLASSSADIIDPDMPLAFSSTPHGRTRVPSVTARHSTSPPMAASKVSTGTRLPYPTGDYAAPEGAFFSPPGSPPSSVNKGRPMSMSNISGLPTGTDHATNGKNTSTSTTSTGNGTLPSSSSSYSAQSFSTVSSISSVANANPTSPTSSPAPATKESRQLPVPAQKASTSSLRQNSTSPTPRKRYTVALGGPIVAPDDYEEQQQQPTRSQSRNGSRANYTSSPGPFENDEDEDDIGEETIGKSKGSGLSAGLKASASAPDNFLTKSLPSSPSNLRVRAQSAYGLSSIAAQSPNTVAALANTNTTQPLRPRVRSKSTDRLDAAAKSFVDPLVLRRQEAATKVLMPKPIGKVPVGQLVAFFDGDRK
ncbi:hypothetical protein Moror_10622 [Moniliophthora roreri MCA 2997]|uniref:Uncharacterized protein n=1 Tax=Moniliophthora roreri (strain MCA 2997) TaxID=1381753 RepID=V2YJ66_MONRO|nr:hypothetical protein Moror_10622 [Moniliophthora roreri MCA 2997]